MKKLLALFLSAAMLFSFTACSKNESGNASNPSDSPNELVGEAMASTPVMTVGEHTVMIPEYNFYYMTSYGQFMNSYGDYASMFGLDITKPFDEQPCGMAEEGSTWHDYFSSQAEQQICFTMAYTDMAKAENMSLNEENKKALKEHIDGIAPFAKENNITEEEYFTKCFGDGMTKDLYTEIIERYYLAVQWQNEQSERIGATKYSDAEIEDYYKQNETQLGVVDYREFRFISPATNAEDETDEQREEYLKKTVSDAHAMADKIKTEKDFIDLALENAPEEDKEKYKNDDMTLKKGASNQGETDEISAWLFDKERKVNDVTVIEGKDTATVLMAVSGVYKNEATAFVDIRHILVMTESEDDEAPTDAQVAQAHEKAQKILEDWQAGEATEESFAKLANEKSEDPGSNTNGGLYEGVVPGKMVAEFNDWCFDPARKPGDVGLVDTTYGTHVMYFSKAGEAAWLSDVKEALSTNAMNKFFDGVTAPYTVISDENGMKVAAQVLAGIEK